MSRSFGLLKPDCLRRGLEAEVLALIESAGLHIVQSKQVRLTRADVDVIWATCRGTYFYEDMVAFSLSGDCIIFIVEGEDAVNRLSQLVGHFDPLIAIPGTIRHRFGISRMENVIHSSLDERAFRAEVNLFVSNPQEERFTVIL